MIAGEKITDNLLNAKNILSKISEYDIFRFYISSRDWQVNRVMNSPIRKDVNPSFIIYQNDNLSLRFKDFAESSHFGDCFQFVQLMFGVNYNKALEIIDKDFGLGIKHEKTKGSPDYIKIISEYKQPVEIEKKYSHIQVITRKFTTEELNYWNQYYQDISDLRENNIYSVKKVYLNRQLLSLKESQLRFGYFYDGKWKIYSPFNSKQTKWIPNNVPITTMDGKENINGCELAFITKSKKDYMVVKKLYPHVCAVQNESWSCFSDENVNFLKNNSNRQVLSFDSDVPGVTNSKMVTEMFNFDYCNVPKYYLKEGIKDWADLAKMYGMQIIEHYLKQKFIIP